MIILKSYLTIFSRSTLSGIIIITIDTGGVIYLVWKHLTSYCLPRAMKSSDWRKVALGCKLLDYYLFKRVNKNFEQFMNHGDYMVSFFLFIYNNLYQGSYAFIIILIIYDNYPCFGRNHLIAGHFLYNKILTFYELFFIFFILGLIVC